ncbi:MAG: sodium/glutamate symporter [Desulfobacteraceae bacterium]|jgi:ESS family glutamate:Na+ symporter
MESPFAFEPVLLFGFLSVLLLVGVVVRAKVRLFQRFLVPSCLIGGILGLILLNADLLPFSFSRLETFAYHFFNISFISVGLTHSNGREEKSKPQKGLLKGSLWMALTQGVVFPLQAIVGGLFVIVLGALGMKLFPTFGFFSPLGFEEGPGQALSIGKVWEGFGFENAATIGLTFAAIGFFFAFFVGVPLVNWGIRKGFSAHTARALSPDVLTGVIPKERKRESAGELTLHSANIDNLAFQAALVGLVNILTYGFVKLLGKFVSPDVAKMLWGFFFIFGLGIALTMRGLMSKVGGGHLIDPGVQRRITGWSVDFLIVSTVAAIQWLVVWTYIVPILAISITSGIVTTLVVVYLGKRIWSYNLERTVAIYGTVTGTVSCGLLLLRIADPEFKTPVVIEIALMNVISIPLIGACLVLLNGPIWWHWSTGLSILVFLAIMTVSLALIRVLKLWGPARF